MSITITGEFKSQYDAQTAAGRLRRRGYIVSSPGHAGPPLSEDKLLVAYPYGAAGGNSPGNGVLGGLPSMAGNSIMVPDHGPVVSVLTDDTQAASARSYLEALGGRIL